MSNYKPGVVVKFKLPTNGKNPYGVSDPDSRPLVIHESYKNRFEDGYFVFDESIPSYIFVSKGIIVRFNVSEDEEKRLKAAKEAHNEKHAPTKGGARKSRNARKNKKRSTRRR